MISVRTLTEPFGRNHSNEILVVRTLWRISKLNYKWLYFHPIRIVTSITNLAVIIYLINGFTYSGYYILPSFIKVCPYT